MEICIHCVYYDDEGSFKSTGWCTITEDYVKENDTCDDFMEE